MRFQNVVMESLAYALPDEILTSDALEQQMAPLYERLKLPYGRLELMTGIKERRFWPVEFAPSSGGAEAGRTLLQKSRIPSEEIDLLIHTGVCRDRLEPATAAYVHGQLGLGNHVQIMDISNACLGFLNGIVLAGGLIESGQIRSALLVSGENGKPLVEHTLQALQDPSLTRNSIKPYFANLTIGAGAIAGLICHRSLAPDGHRILGGVVDTDTSHNELCQGNTASAGFGLEMQTDSEALLEAGLEVARRAWSRFKVELDWTESTPRHVITHQVGKAHRNRLFHSLNLDLEKDFSTFDTLGNVGSVSLPITLAKAVEAGRIQKNDTISLLGIGSGLSSMMLGLQW